jgi:hypothetical protein
MLFSVIRDDQVEEAMDILGRILGCTRGERGKGLAVVLPVERAIGIC